MATFEASGPCTLGEYEAWEQYRLQAEELVVSEEYMLMMRFKSAVSGRRAGKHLVRLSQVVPVETEGMHRVHFDFIHDVTKRTVVEDLSFNLHDGRIDLFSSSLTSDILKTPLAGGYLKGDFDAQDITVWSEQFELQLPDVVPRSRLDVVHSG